MSFLSRLFARDDLHDQAERLVEAARVIAVSSFIPLLDDAPWLKTVKAESWDFFATAGAVFVALNNLKGAVPAKRFTELYSVVLSAMREWDEKGEDAAIDCLEFVAKNVPVMEGQHAAIDALGLWVLWNILQRQPTYEEAKAARMIGGLLSGPLHDWWDK